MQRTVWPVYFLSVLVIGFVEGYCNQQFSLTVAFAVLGLIPALIASEC